MIKLDRNKITTIGKESIWNTLIDFRRRKQYKIIELYVKQKTNIVMNDLNLPLIKVSFDKKYNNCHFRSGRNEKGTVIKSSELKFGLPFLLYLLYPECNKAVPNDRFIFRIYHVICHEIAHYLQYHKHNRWFKTFVKGYNGYTASCLYGTQKLESNANKIAGILLRRYKKELKNTSKFKEVTLKNVFKEEV